jgi:hypothetical protein
MKIETVSILKYILTALLSIFIYAQFQPSPKAPEPIVKQEQDQECKTTIVKRTNPDGSVDEVTEFIAKNGQKQEIKPSPGVKQPNYGVGIYNDKTIFGEVRLGSTSLFLIGETNFQQARIGIKLQF